MPAATTCFRMASRRRAFSILPASTVGGYGLPPCRVCFIMTRAQTLSKALTTATLGTPLSIQYALTGTTTCGPEPRTAAYSRFPHGEEESSTGGQTGGMGSRTTTSSACFRILVARCGWAPTATGCSMLTVGAEPSGRWATASSFQNARFAAS